MDLLHRPIDYDADRDYVLERHCRNNYECDTPWKRELSYEDYHAEWFGLQGQVNGFYEALRESSGDNRTIAEIIESSDGKRVAYLWAPFAEDAESGFCFAELQDIYVEEEYRHTGVATALIGYVEEKAKTNGARVVRSGTGCENHKSIELHKKLGFYQYRYEFEKLL